MTEPASITRFLERIHGPRKTVTLYGQALPEQLVSFLGRFSLEVEHESLPIAAAEGYLTVHADDTFLGSIPAAAYADLLDPPRAEPWDPATRDSALRDLTDFLRDSTFTWISRASACTLASTMSCLGGCSTTCWTTLSSLPKGARLPFA